MYSRSSFSQPYRNGGHSPYAAAYHNPADRSFSDLYEYTDDQHNVLSPRVGARYPSAFEEDEAPDVVHVRYVGDSWSLDFPPFSIAEEKVLVRHVRDRVAQRIGCDGQEGRVRLIYKDKELKRNDVPLRKYGCKQNSEIFVRVTNEARDYNSRRPKQTSGSDSDSVASSHKGGRSTEDDRRQRADSTYRRREEDARGYQPGPAPAHANGYLHPHHSTPPNGDTPPRQSSPVRPTPTSSYPPRQTSISPTTAQPTSAPRTTAPPIQPPQVDTSTPLGKLQAMRYEFHTEWKPKLEVFIRSPPSDKDDRDKEYRRLNEIVYKRVFDIGDAIEADGKEEVRAARKQLYKEAQHVLKDLDRFKPKD